MTWSSRVLFGHFGAVKVVGIGCGKVHIKRGHWVPSNSQLFFCEMAIVPHQANLPGWVSSHLDRIFRTQMMTPLLICSMALSTASSLLSSIIILFRIIICFHLSQTTHRPTSLASFPQDHSSCMHIRGHRCRDPARVLYSDSVDGDTRSVECGWKVTKKTSEEFCCLSWSRLFGGIGGFMCCWWGPS